MVILPLFLIYINSMKKGIIFNIMVGNPHDVNLLAEKAMEVIYECSTQHSIHNDFAIVPHHFHSAIR